MGTLQVWSPRRRVVACADSFNVKCPFLAIVILCRSVCAYIIFILDHSKLQTPRPSLRFEQVTNHRRLRPVSAFLSRFSSFIRSKCLSSLRATLLKIISVKTPDYLVSISLVLCMVNKLVTNQSACSPARVGEPQTPILVSQSNLWQMSLPWYDDRRIVTCAKFVVPVGVGIDLLVG